MKLSIIAPTYNERDNIPAFLSSLNGELNKSKINGEIIVVDDNSPDGTGEILEQSKVQYKNLKVIHRAGKLGLSSAVTEGFASAEGDILAVMDADLSHPAEKISEMYSLCVRECDMVIGSRYVKGGKIEGWSIYRKVLSKGATILARVFVSVKDPMSGFFMFRKNLIQGKEINSKGFKILLELLIKANFAKIAEVPIVFTNRTAGKSKAGGREILAYLRNLFGYLPHKKEIIVQFFKFSFVGLMGTLINIIILYALTDGVGIYYILSAFFAYFVAMSFNFIMNKTWTFRERARYLIGRKYLKFFLVSLSALSVNLFFLYIFTEFFKIYYLISQVLAIGIALTINFLGNKIFTFQT